MKGFILSVILLLFPISIAAQKVIQRSFFGVEIGSKVEETERIISGRNLNIIESNEEEIVVTDVHFGGYLWNICWLTHYCDMLYDITFMRNVEDCELNKEFEGIKSKLDFAYKGKDIFIKEEKDSNGYNVFTLADESGMMVMLSISPQKGRNCIRLDYTNILVKSLKFKEELDEF